MKKTTNKIVLIGAGAVGTSFLYWAMSKGVADEYAIIDVNKDAAKGQELDFEDASPSAPSFFSVKSGDYNLLKDADLVVITAGRPQKPGETRLEMVADNAKIMKQIALEVKKAKFDGITLIASNPVDVMTTVYQYVTNFDSKKVISSSCTLDTNRLKFEFSKIFNVNPNDLNMFVMGEHGDSSVSTLEFATLNGIPLKDHYADKKIDANKKAEIHKKVYMKAYEIINRKRATFYGIGAVLAEISQSIIRDERKIFSTGSLLNGEYGEKGVYAGVPSVIGRNGIVCTYQFPLSKEELLQFKKSVSILKETTKKALAAIK
ncbi:L-lactate dehydrogenase [Candidatus Hepatoplasma crinochetorum]|uniref:L-lactate dehydrogenase n=1 Tax=Candidatus Hepatoplasma crinochetorum TaxID=295596 RepID=UPI00308A42D7|nr:MAG: L-lactate dehydrogenase [Candidatus Hepatoplasma crinochetorum]